MTARAAAVAPTVGVSWGGVGSMGEGEAREGGGGATAQATEVLILQSSSRLAKVVSS